MFSRTFSKRFDEIYGQDKDKVDFQPVNYSNIASYIKQDPILTGGSLNVFVIANKNITHLIRALN